MKNTVWIPSVTVTNEAKEAVRAIVEFRKNTNRPGASEKAVASGAIMDVFRKEVK